MTTTAIDIPTALTEAETTELQRLAKGANVLEVGALLGYSTVALAQVAELVVSVDPHVGYPANDPKPTLLPFWENLQKYGVSNKVVPIVTTIQQARSVLWGDFFDLAFVDVTGEYEDTLDAMWAAYKLLSCETGDGVLAVHDCGHPEWPGVRRAVDEFANILGERYRVVDRLSIFQGL